MEWTTVAGAAVGGAIAITGDLIGQISVRKQAAKQRRETLEDAQRTRDRTMEDEHRKELRKREKQAKEKMIASILNARISILDPLGKELNQEEIIKRSLDVCVELSIESVHILDDELRWRLQICSDILDMAITPSVNLREQRLNEVFAIVRRNVWSWLGASLRGQAIPPATRDWINLVSELDDVKTQWKAWLTQAGYEI